MKILITTSIYPPETRGPATYISGLIEHSPRIAAVITFTQNPKDFGVPVYSVSVTGGTLLRQWRLFTKILAWGKNCDLIYAQGADVVGLASVLAGKLLGKKVVIKFVGDLFDELERDFGKTDHMVQFTTWICLHLADKIIFPARHLQTAIINRYKIPPGRTTVIYNAIA